MAVAYKFKHTLTVAEASTLNGGDFISLSFLYPSSFPGNNYSLALSAETVTGLGTFTVAGVSAVKGTGFTVSIVLAIGSSVNDGEIVGINAIMQGIQ